MRLPSVQKAYAALERMGVATFRRIDAAYARARRGPGWPVTPGAYSVGNPAAPIAVCTLTTATLSPVLARLPGVAIAGRLYTSNIGIEKLVRNVVANERIRVLLVCGQESPLFQPAHSLCALVENGVDAQRKIVGAAGYLPVLSGIDGDSIGRFRRQTTLVDRAGETDAVRLAEEVGRLAQELGWIDGGPRSQQGRPLQTADDDDRFVVLRPGGKRETLAYDPTGYFVITLERESKMIAAHHYLPDASPAHVMRGRSGEGMVLALIREGLVTQMTHAAYLGAEFCKAETALRLGLEYDQDRPLQDELARPIG